VPYADIGKRTTVELRAGFRGTETQVWHGSACHKYVKRSEAAILSLIGHVSLYWPSPQRRETRVAPLCYGVEIEC
jgi:hypothetical protein